MIFGQSLRKEERLQISSFVQDNAVASNFDFSVDLDEGTYAGQTVLNSQNMNDAHLNESQRKKTSAMSFCFTKFRDFILFKL